MRCRVEMKPSGYADTDPDTETVYECERTDEAARGSRGFRNWVVKLLGAPAEVVTSVRKMPGENTPAGKLAWRVTYTDATHCAYWRLAGIPLSDPRHPEWDGATFRWATGWESYTSRMDAFLGEPGTIQDPNMRRALRESEGATAQELGLALRHLQTMCAAHAFGRHPRSPATRRRDTMSDTLYRWYTTLRAALHAEKHNEWSAVCVTYGRALRETLMEGVEATRDTDRQAWRGRVAAAAVVLIRAHRARKRIEMANADANRKDSLDAALLRNIGHFLDETIRPQKARCGGADWPTDEDGNVPALAEERRALNQRIYRTKLETRTPQPLETKTWLAELKRTSGRFSDESRDSLEADITEEELGRVYKDLKPGTSPGPSGTTYKRWKSGGRRVPEACNRLLQQNHAHRRNPGGPLTRLGLPNPERPEPAMPRGERTTTDDARDRP